MSRLPIRTDAEVKSNLVDDVKLTPLAAIPEPAVLLQLFKPPLLEPANDEAGVVPEVRRRKSLRFMLLLRLVDGDDEAAAATTGACRLM